MLVCTSRVAVNVTIVYNFIYETSFINETLEIHLADKNTSKLVKNDSAFSRKIIIKGCNVGDC